MPSLRNVFFSRPSSSSSSDSPLGSERSPESRRRLTRQRKFRHVTEFDLGLGPIDDWWKSLPVSPNSGSRSPPNLRHRSMSAVPQPLPLPESLSPSLVKANENFLSPRSGRGGVGVGNSSSSVMGRKSTDHIAPKSSKIPTYHRRGFHQNTTGTAHSFRLDVPARSAPTTGFSSPAVSPQRFSSPAVSPQRFRSEDVLHLSYSVPREFKVSSTSEVSIFDGQGFASHVLPERITPSPDHSPLHSPTLQSPHHNIRNPNGVAWHSHFKSLPESSVSRPEGNSANVHPLPLPPGSPVPSHSSNSSHTMDGSSMKGQWQKDTLIGRGTYGSVYVGISSKDGAMCAIKEVDVISCDSKSAECIKQLEQEIKVLQQLKHPNIVQYFGSEIFEDRFCIYLEYVHPGSINNYVREHFGAVTESVVRNFTRHILSGLAYLHSTRTIHRDIKGANLLVNASGVVKLADFGLAKHLTGCAADLSLKGSPHWMAPEVLQSMLRKDANPELAFAVDIWSVGCTVIEMLTGKPPWSEFTGVQAMFQVLHRSPAIPETLSVEGKDFLRQCFQRNPADRPTAAMLLDHPFLRNLHGRNVSSCRQEFCGLKLNDTSISPRDWNKHKDLKPLFSQCMWSKLGRALTNGETREHSCPESSDAGAAHPSISSSDLYYNLHNMNSNASNSWHPRAGNYHPRLVFKTEVREMHL